jgi:hypothetical protein
MKTFSNAGDIASIIDRLNGLTPASERLWGTMSAPRMIAHLTDQMTHTLGIVEAKQQSGWRRNAVIRNLAIYVVPWPKGRIRGPADAFITEPGEWQRDLEKLIGYVEQFGSQEPTIAWPPHAVLGPMSRKDWGAFCWKHFDHHLRQFGV